jgi:hypothetical protein
MTSCFSHKGRIVVMVVVVVSSAIVLPSTSESRVMMERMRTIRVRHIVPKVRDCHCDSGAIGARRHSGAVAV